MTSYRYLSDLDKGKMGSGFNQTVGIHDKRTQSAPFPLYLDPD